MTDKRRRAGGMAMLLIYPMDDKVEILDMSHAVVGLVFPALIPGVKTPMDATIRDPSKGDTTRTHAIVVVIVVSVEVLRSRCEWQTCTCVHWSSMARRSWTPVASWDACNWLRRWN